APVASRLRPLTTQDRVAARSIIRSLAERVENWDKHATLIAGCFGCGKTVAREEALGGRQGVHVHRVEGNAWKKELYEGLDLDNELMLETVFRAIRDKLGKPPVLVLDIPRSTKEGMGSISGFAKSFSSDKSLVHVIVCASSAAMPIAFDAGGPNRQKNFWAPCLPWRSCSGGFNALELVDACQRYAVEGERALKAKKAEMKESAYEDVKIFLRDCKFKTDITDTTPAGAGSGVDVGKLAGGSCALPQDVAMWIRAQKCHPVIWRTVERKYQFASELHAEAATEILNSPSQQSPKERTCHGGR
ncbi:unnamed protein product, partial [Symbiodinium necroappetens]